MHDHVALEERAVRGFAAQHEGGPRLPDPWDAVLLFPPDRVEQDVDVLPRVAAVTVLGSVHVEMLVVGIGHVVGFLLLASGEHVVVASDVAAVGPADPFDHVTVCVEDVALDPSVCATADLHSVAEPVHYVVVDVVAHYLHQPSVGLREAGDGRVPLRGQHRGMRIG